VARITLAVGAWFQPARPAALIGQALSTPVDWGAIRAGSGPPFSGDGSAGTVLASDRGAAIRPAGAVVRRRASAHRATDAAAGGPDSL